jgi:hypothetical protein
MVGMQIGATVTKQMQKVRSDLGDEASVRQTRLLLTDFADTSPIPEATGVLPFALRHSAATGKLSRFQQSKPAQ